ncbi:MAG: hypothetical protein H6835_04335 [Planctomycetes bacterium]|nr:hypothetical protein [Planctomycetota bacterium]
MERPHDEAAQTPGQWAVRWFAVVAVAVLCASVPLVDLVWHGLLGRAEPPLRTRSQVTAPAATVANVTDGSWMKQKERELRERSPIVWWLRGNWNELRYRCGVPQSVGVEFGDDGWLFLKRTLYPDVRGFGEATAARRAFLVEVRDRVRAAGAELLVTIVPDKARVYPEHAWPGRAENAARTANYARILAELGELEIPTVDLVAALRAHRAQPLPGVPDGELYYRRDTHWRPAGALVAGIATATAIEQRFGGRLSPRRVMQPTGETVVRAVGDLTDQLGLLSAIQPDPLTGQRPVALSLLTDELAEPRSYYGVAFTTPQGLVQMDGEDPAAEVLLVGTSFAEENGMGALSLALGRAVRAVTARGAEGLSPIRQVLDELPPDGAAGSAAKVVVWEIVERGIFADAWHDPAR